MKCKNCSSKNIEVGVSIGQTAEVGHIGPQYKKSIFVGVSPMYCDICLKCGELARLYIKDDTNKKWYKR